SALASDPSSASSRRAPVTCLSQSPKAIAHARTRPHTHTQTTTRAPSKRLHMHTHTQTHTHTQSLRHTHLPQRVGVRERDTARNRQGFAIEDQKERADLRQDR